jgi:hypothetical protein
VKRGYLFLIGFLSVLGALAIGWFGKNAYERQILTTTLPVPRGVIEPYTLLSADLFALQEFPRSLAGLPYHQTLADLDGKITTVRLQPGLPVAAASAVSTELYRLADASLEVFSIPVSPEIVIGGRVQIGDRLNLYLLTDKEIPQDDTSNQVKPSIPNPTPFPVEFAFPGIEGLGKDRLGVAILVAQSVPVVDVRTSGGESVSGTGNAQSVLPGGSDSTQRIEIITLAQASDQARQTLAVLAEILTVGGKLWLSLAPPIP